ncbi:PLP-dependent aminotransferase family protein [Candidatus Clostridium stratigraminis]|uniref:PLP-dependent aminotransferase family protein n=1 Tax=Candidatus Clostridium stratigraminis TaxID=3381661 RepID=A0ABW8T3T2_9CLOT
MFLSEIIFNSSEPLYLQIETQIIKMIEENMLVEGSKLPSTRELSEILKVSRNSCMHAYELLEDKGYIKVIKGKGAYVFSGFENKKLGWVIDWNTKISNYGKRALELDIVKNEAVTKKNMISFKSIAPDEKLFNLEQIRRDFLNSISFEGEKIFNYGYAMGYKPLLDKLKEYVKNKGIDLLNKEVIITNGFTEGFDITLAALTNKGDLVLCENPTHNTAIKLMRLHGLEIHGVDIDENGINLAELQEKLAKNKYKLIYLIPSYHNPTGTVMSADKRMKVYKLCKKNNLPIIEDGFNEELLYSSSHVASIAALATEDNSVVYIGSFSKILFPGIRIGWIVADKNLISSLESIKRSRNIHSSVLDQAFLYEFLKSGDYGAYLKRARKHYREKYIFIMNLTKIYLSNCKIYGEGGLHIFIKLYNIDARSLLDLVMRHGAIFMPGDVFYVDEKGKDTLRLGFSRLSLQDIEKGIKILGKCIDELSANHKIE